MPQCPCDMYSHRQTSPISSRPGTSRLMARVAFCTMPSSAHAPVAISSLVSGSPNRITLGMPSAFTSAHSFTASSMERLNTPGMERTSLRTPSPGQTNSGYTKPSGAEAGFADKRAHRFVAAQAAGTINWECHNMKF